MWNSSPGSLSIFSGTNLASDATMSYFVGLHYLNDNACASYQGWKVNKDSEGRFILRGVEGSGEQASKQTTVFPPPSLRLCLPPSLSLSLPLSLCVSVCAYVRSRARVCVCACVRVCAITLSHNVPELSDVVF
jgi:hypothetical protein